MLVAGIAVFSVPLDLLGLLPRHHGVPGVQKSVLDQTIWRWPGSSSLSTLL